MPRVRGLGAVFVGHHGTFSVLDQEEENIAVGNEGPVGKETTILTGWDLTRKQEMPEDREAWRFGGGGFWTLSLGKESTAPTSTWGVLVAVAV